MNVIWLAFACYAAGNVGDELGPQDQEVERRCRSSPPKRAVAAAPHACNTGDSSESAIRSSAEHAAGEGLS